MSFPRCTRRDPRGVTSGGGLTYVTFAQVLLHSPEVPQGSYFSESSSRNCRICQRMLQMVLRLLSDDRSTLKRRKVQSGLFQVLGSKTQDTNTTCTHLPLLSVIREVWEHRGWHLRGQTNIPPSAPNMTKQGSRTRHGLPWRHRNPKKRVNEYLYLCAVESRGGTRLTGWEYNGRKHGGYGSLVNRESSMSPTKIRQSYYFHLIKI